MDTLLAPTADPDPTSTGPVSPAGIAGSGPALPPAPALAGVAAAASDASRSAFRYLNRWAAVPLHRAGLAAWLGNPLTGWQCLITTIGSRTGLERPTPLGYLVREGAAWVLAGYGPSTLWYRNLLEQPKVTLLLPGRPPIAARAVEERDPETRARIIPALARTMPLPALSLGSISSRAPDERILAATAWVPLVRISARDGLPIVAGPDDPGGHGWVWRQLVLAGLALEMARLARGRHRPG